MYATQQDIINKYDEITLRRLSSKSNDGDINVVVVNDALSNASAIIDGYISSQYDLPLSSEVSLLRSYCVDIAVYEMATGQSMMSDDIKERHENAKKFLADVGKGKFSLGLSKKQKDAATSNKIIFSKGNPRLFGRDAT